VSAAVRGPTLTLLLLALLGCGSVSQKGGRSSADGGAGLPRATDGGPVDAPSDAAANRLADGAGVPADGGSAPDSGIPLGGPAGWDSPAARWDQAVWR
jgi:hypothetical protein